METTSEFKEPSIAAMIAYVDEAFKMGFVGASLLIQDNVSAEQKAIWNEHIKQQSDMYTAIRGQLLAVQMYNRTHPDGISNLGRMLGAFKRAKDLIRQWHSFSGNNSRLPREEVIRRWDVYDRNSPEMKELNSMIEWLGKEVVDGN